MKQKYIAFISYRHNPLDTAAAVKIHRLIERFVIPKKLRKNGTNKLGIVFRDADELNISSDLSAALCDALDNSEYLLVMCTPQYKESEWCRQEITYFLKNHDIDHVLPVLVQGTPQESFPEELFRRYMSDGMEVIAEPLAANVAADTTERIEKNISHEYLRIIARMLECNYDELVQRRKNYERKRRIIGFGTVFAVLIAFIGMLLFKNSQINEQYLETRKNQARDRVTLSMEQYYKGNRSAAIESVLSVLPEGKDKGPVVPEQMYALSTVTNAYNFSYAPVDLMNIESGNYFFSDDLEHFFVYSPYIIQIYDISGKELCYTLSVKELVKSHPEIDENSYIKRVVPVDKNRFVLSIGENLYCLDIDDASYFRRVYTGINNIKLVDYAEGNIAFCETSENAENIVVIRLENGEVLYRNNFKDDSGTSEVEYSIKDISWNQSGTSLAIGFDYKYKPVSEENLYNSDIELNKEEEIYFSEHPAYGTVILEPDSGKIKIISNHRTVKVSYKGNSIASEHYYYPTIKTYHVFTDAVKCYFASLYSVPDGKCILNSDIITAEATNTFGNNYGIIKYNNESTKVYLMWIGNKAAVIDANSKEVLYMDSFHSDIVYMGTVNNRNISLVLANGSIQHIACDGNSNLRVNQLKLDYILESAREKDGTYYIIPHNSSTLIRCAVSEWTGYMKVKTSDELLETFSVSEIQYEETDREVLRIVKYQADKIKYVQSNYCSGFEIYSSLSENVLFTYTPQDPQGVINHVAVSKDNSVITIVEQTSEFATIVSGFSLADGKILFQHINEETEEFGYKENIVFSSDRKSFFWIYNEENFKNTFYCYDISGKTVSLSSFVSESVVSDLKLKPVMTSDNNYLTWLSKDSGTKLEVYNIKTKKKNSITFPDTFKLAYNSAMTPVRDSIVMINSETEITLIDVSSGNILPSIDVKRGSKAAFLSGSNELVVANDSSIELIDFETRNLKSKLNLDFSVSDIITDSSKDKLIVKKSGQYSSINDNGWELSASYLIGIDKERKMYIQFNVQPDKGLYISPAGKEIVMVSPDNKGEFWFDHFRSFEELAEKARELISDK